MKHFAIIPAAGPIAPDGRKDRQFPSPRPLIDLGAETVVGRLVRQARQAGMEVLVAVGQVGHHGWRANHLAEFEVLDCKLCQSPALEPRRLIGSVVFLLKQLLSTPELECDSKIFNLFGDWVLTDDLFGEILSYQAPCIYEFKEREWNFVLTAREIPPFLDLLKKYLMSYGYNRLWLAELENRREGSAFHALNFNVHGPRYDYDVERFVEIDWLWEIQDALDLVTREAGA